MSQPNSPLSDKVRRSGVAPSPETRLEPAATDPPQPSTSSVKLSARERRVHRASLTVRPTLEALERLEKMCATLNYTKQAVFDTALEHVLIENGF